MKTANHRLEAMANKPRLSLTNAEIAVTKKGGIDDDS